MGKGLPGFYSAWASVLVHRMMSGVRGSSPTLIFKWPVTYLTQTLGLETQVVAASDSVECLEGPYPTDRPELMGGKKGMVLLEGDPWKGLDW